MANASSAPNSKVDWPRKLVRASSHAIRRPSAAQTGAASAASLRVVNSEFQAVPAQTRPPPALASAHCRSKAVTKWRRVGV